jgi:hypothetical protein
VDLVATGPNGLGGWRFGVPVLTNQEVRIDWKLRPSIDVAGKVHALDGKTPLGSVVLELIRPNEASSIETDQGTKTARSESGLPNPKPGLEPSPLASTLASNRVLHQSAAGSYVQLPAGIFDNLTEATIEAWVKSSQAGEWVPIFCYGNGNRRNVWMGMIDRTNLLAGIFFGTPFGTECFAQDVLRPNEWFHVAFITGQGGERLFLNGVLVATNSFTGSFSASEKGVGNFIGQDFDNNLLGQMDDFRVWNVQHSDAEIRDGMFKRLAGNEPGLVGLWNFDDPANPGRDASPGAHHGKFMGQATATNAAVPRLLVFGKITDTSGRALEGASVTVRSANGPERSFSVNTAGEYSFTMDSSEPCDVFVTNGELSAYRIAFQPNGESPQRLDWTLADPEKTPVVLGSSGLGVPASAGSASAIPQRFESLNARPAEAGTPNPPPQFPAGTVVASMLSDEQGNFKFPNVQPGRYQVRAQIPGGRGWFESGRILYAEPELPAAERTRLASLDFRLAPFKKGRWTKFSVLQNYYSIASRDIEREIVPMAVSEGLGIMPWSPLAGGFLSGKYTRAKEKAGDSRRDNFDFPPINKLKAFEIIDQMVEIANAHNVTVAQVALAWMLSKPRMLSSPMILRVSRIIFHSSSE